MKALLAHEAGRQGLPATSTCSLMITRGALGLLLLGAFTILALGSPWSDDFSAAALSSEWSGDRDYFAMEAGVLRGMSASPLAPVPLRWVEVGNDWADYVVTCRINVMTPNLLVCTKGALILRHRGHEGYVFALHVATKTVEVYRLSDQQMLLRQETPLELQRWYRVRAELQGERMSFFVDDQLVGQISDLRSPSGAVGLGVQDALSVLYDDFTVTGLPAASPPLSITRVEDKMALAWPMSARNHILQVADDLTPPVKWTTVTISPVESGGQNTVVLEVEAGRRFYRLSP